MNISGVQWLFFDMGSTLLDSTDAYAVWFQNASAAIGGALSPAQIEAGYLEGMARYTPTIVGQLKLYGFQGESSAHLYPVELDRAYPQAEKLLRQLSGRYRLAVIANQSAGAAERLRRLGLLAYFDFVLGSADVGLQKPDPRIFRLALEKAGCKPGEAAMIGDRPDFDIFPAKQLGLRTLRVRQGPAACQAPRSPAYEADVTVDSLDGLGRVLLG